MEIIGIEGIYKFLLFQAIFPHHVDCKLIDGKEVFEVKWSSLVVLLVLFFSNNVIKRLRNGQMIRAILN